MPRQTDGTITPALSRPRKTAMRIFFLIGVVANPHVLIGCNGRDELAASAGPGAIEDSNHQRGFPVAAHRNSNDRHDGDRQEKQRDKPPPVSCGAGAIGRGSGRNNIQSGPYLNLSAAMPSAP